MQKYLVEILECPKCHGTGKQTRSLTISDLDISYILTQYLTRIGKLEFEGWEIKCKS